MSTLNEEVQVELCSKAPLARAQLHRRLKAFGLTSIDDFYVLPRHDRVYPWQGEDVMIVDVRLNQASIYETEYDIDQSGGGSWDALLLTYPLASVPLENLEVFVETAEKIAAEFDLSVCIDGCERSLSVLREQWAAAAEELPSEPGSELLALLIRSESRVP